LAHNDLIVNNQDALPGLRRFPAAGGIFAFMLRYSLEPNRSPLSRCAVAGGLPHGPNAFPVPLGGDQLEFEVVGLPFLDGEAECLTDPRTVLAGVEINVVPRKARVVILLQSMHVPPIEVWRDYNGRAGVENVIKELVHGFGLPKLCCKSFWATEAALSLAVLTYNLNVLFARHLGWLDKVTIGTLRFRLLATAAILSHAQGGTHIKLGIPLQNRPWWRTIWEKLLGKFPNCNAVAQAP
jgi:hypothetical protein